MTTHTRFIVTHYGGPDALRAVEEACPEPRAGEVRVRVMAAGVSLPDVMMREGVHPETPRVPFTPGWDLVGVVDRIGAGVSDRKSTRLNSSHSQISYAVFCLKKKKKKEENKINEM